jgi:hypothetical protein
MLRWLLVLLAACTAAPAASLTGTGTRLAGEDALFHQDPRWLGADGAYTIDLGGGRVLWLFGDTFIADTAADTRTASTMVRNSVAVMTGDDPATATMAFAWRDGSPPDSFFAENGSNWFWPSDGIRIANGPLVVFLSQQTATSEGLGFAAAGYRAVGVADPSGSAATWQLVDVPVAPAPFDANASVACSALDGSAAGDGGSHLVAVLVTGDSHDGRLARWPTSQIAALDLSSPEWWDGSAWSATTTEPAIVLPGGSTECSLQQIDNTWVQIASHGFGASTIAIRTARALTGPWSEADDVFTPPESQVANPFVYAGKGHPALTTHTPNGAIVITYADNSFTFSDLLDPANAATLYWPHVAELALHPAD